MTDWQTRIEETAGEGYAEIIEAKARAGIGEYDQFLKAQRQGFGKAWGVYEKNMPRPDETPAAYLERFMMALDGPQMTEADCEALLNEESNEIFIEKFAELIVSKVPDEDDTGGVQSGIERFISIVGRECERVQS